MISSATDNIPQPVSRSLLAQLRAVGVIILGQNTL